MSDAVSRPQFDRSIPESLLALLRPGGRLAGLTARVARDQGETLDLHLRADSKKRGAEGWVTLYVGLTKAFDLHGRRDGAIRVEPQPSHGPVEEAHDRGWTRWIPAEHVDSDAFLRWADAMIGAGLAESAAKIENEGAVQARVSMGVTEWFSAIDRETMFAFKSEASRTAGLARVGGRLDPAARRVRDENAAWPRAGGKPARKLDVLAVDADGRVLVIEVKPGHQTGTLAWTPYQVAQYVAQCRAWADGEPRASGILNKMLSQRETLGLLEPPGRRVAAPVELVPVIAVGLRKAPSVEAERRMDVVYQAVRAAAPELVRGLEVWGVEPEPRGAIWRTKLGHLREGPGSNSS